MPFEFLEDAVTSDVTFHAWGASLDELFGAAAEATTQLMVDSLDRVVPRVRRLVAVQAEALDLLLAHFLDELIFLKDVDRLLLRVTRVEVEPDPPRLRAELAGEPIDPARHELAADVKAVTLHGLQVEQRAGTWHAQVTLDV